LVCADSRWVRVSVLGYGHIGTEISSCTSRVNFRGDGAGSIGASVEVGGISDKGSSSISNNRSTLVDGRRDIYRATGVCSRRSLNVSSDGSSIDAESRCYDVVGVDLRRNGQENGNGGENFGEHGSLTGSLDE